MYQALYRKWRPCTFDDVVGQPHITETLKRQVQSGRLSHAYLFTGTRGTGKTSCAKILARAVNCQQPEEGNPCNRCPSCLGIENGSILDVLELDAASNNGVDQVRALRDEAVYTPTAVKKRVYIIDEVHMLTTQAFNALLKILEEPPEHLMFVLATTELHKVPATIKSRCQQFAFKRILPAEIAGRLAYVAAHEGIDLTPEGAVLLARLADGSLRDAMSLLDQCVTPGGTLGEEQVLHGLGLAGNLETARLMTCIAQRDTESALAALGRLYGGGKDVGALLGELSALCRDLLIRKTAPNQGALLLTGGYDETVLRTLGEQLSTARLAQMLDFLQCTIANLSRSGNRRTDAELCLLRLCDETLDGSAVGYAARLERLEALVERGVQPKASEQAAPKASEQAAPKAPQTDQDAPPWEMPAAPVERPAPAAEPQEKAPPAPKPGRSTASAQAGPDFWPAFVAALRGKVSPMVYTYLRNPNFVSSGYADGVLTLWVESDLVKKAINKPEELAALTELAQRQLGSPLRICVEVGQPEGKAQTQEQTQAQDHLDDLLAAGRQFENIIIKD